jgi:predicted acyl esterase
MPVCHAIGDALLSSLASVPGERTRKELAIGAALDHNQRSISSWESDMRLRISFAPAIAALLLLLTPLALSAQGLEYVKANYTKYEYRIPARDGKKLFTAVYVPKDTTKTYPILLSRTPYNVGPYGVDQYKDNLGPSPLFGKEGYIFAYQDVRGRWMSEGEYVNMRPQIPRKAGPQEVDESSDTYDTIDWLVKNIPGNNGKVGMWGISYPGFYTAAGTIDAHPALKAASPQAPINDWFMGDDWHHNGALFLPHIFNFMARFGHERPEPTKKFNFPFDHDTPDGYEFFLRLGPIPNVNAKYYKDKIAFWSEALRRFLEGSQPASALEEHQARGNDRGGLVRRREPLWRLGDL